MLSYQSNLNLTLIRGFAVNTQLKEHIAELHAFSQVRIAGPRNRLWMVLTRRLDFQKTYTPAQWAQLQPKDVEMAQ